MTHRDRREFGRPVGAGHESALHAELVGSRLRESPKDIDDAVGGRQRERSQPAEHGGHRMQVVGERCDDAEVSAPASQRPDEVSVLLFACDEHVAVGGHRLGGDEVVDCQAVLALQPPVAPAERQSGDTRR